MMMQQLQSQSSSIASPISSYLAHFTVAHQQPPCPLYCNNTDKHEQQQSNMSPPPSKTVYVLCCYRAEGKQRNKYDERAVEGVMDIPELEEEGKEDITRVVAQAPKGHAPRVQAMSELEQDQGWLPTKAESEDIDLSLLTVCLLPSDQVIEPPDVWDYDLLFSQLKAELQNEVGSAEPRDGAEDLRQI
eukprot:GHUV01029388.1.p1 GENE.GHUV01029388.1~~GHUV01029388.1.p1  ORF type:complete len:188 (+),score=55.33 GHUV01029388.1:781-1344(+)